MARTAALRMTTEPCGPPRAPSGSGPSVAQGLEGGPQGRVAGHAGGRDGLEERRFLLVGGDAGDGREVRPVQHLERAPA